VYLFGVAEPLETDNIKKSEDTLVRLGVICHIGSVEPNFFQNLIVGSVKTVLEGEFCLGSPKAIQQWGK
jgi:hypothetical protein